MFRENSTVTCIGHNFCDGDIVQISSDGRAHRLMWLLRRPRVLVAAEVTHSTFTVIERRMTWAQWRRAIWSTILS